MSIKLLDQHMAELIAAGEVVERPASVVKELVENAIDAGATSIQVDIEHGGIELIRVSDNGTGIQESEIPVAFLRHATSKVSKIEDLEGISTLGFRGEALPSIASVAKVELLTAIAEGDSAALYTIHGGVEQGLEPAARSTGTTISIHNLFYNVPARMKFLKKDTSEGMYVTETVTRLALSHPDISFRFLRDQKPVLQTPGDGKLETAVYSVMGSQFAKNMISVRSESVPYSVYGLVTSPLEGRASRSMQYFYINGRFVKNRTMMAALEQAYKGMAMQGKFPGCALFLEMPASLVDVNVHPAKTEVRFANEGDVFGAVYRAVKSALLGNQDKHRQVEFAGSNSEISTADVKIKQPEAEPFQKSHKDDNAYTKPTGGNKTATDGKQNYFGADNPGKIKAYNDMVVNLASTAEYTPYRTASQQQSPSLDIMGSEEQESPKDNLSVKEKGLFPDSLEGEAAQETKPETMQVSEQTELPVQEQPKLNLVYVGEIFSTYILAQEGDKLCIIDKHAAHERILYEKLAAQDNEIYAQQLLEPVSVQLSASEKDALLQNKDTLMNAGIEVDDFGAGSVLVRSVPSDIETIDVADMIVELASKLELNNKDTITEKREWVLHSMACRAATKAGDKTPASALISLARDILSGDIPHFCPHGRPVVIEMTKKELEKQFGRLG